MALQICLASSSDVMRDRKFLSPDGVYYGYEINPVGLNFIRSAYRNRPNFHFDGQLLHLDEDYVAKLRGQRRPETIGATEVDLTRLVSQPLDIQWSASVFTHMWPDAITHVLKQVRRLLKPGAVCVNSWLMIDDHASYVLRCGLADRQLPFLINGAYTCSEENPLVCTAYPIDTIRDIYAKAGHEITEIVRGWWAGNAPKNGPQQQDIIISKAIAQ